MKESGRWGREGEHAKAVRAFFYTGQAVWGIVHTSFISVIHVCVTHRLCVSLEVVLQGERGVVEPELLGS